MGGLNRVFPIPVVLSHVSVNETPRGRFKSSLRQQDMSELDVNLSRGLSCSLSSAIYIETVICRRSAQNAV